MPLNSQSGTLQAETFKIYWEKDVIQVETGTDKSLTRRQLPQVFYERLFTTGDGSGKRTKADNDEVAADEN